MPFRGLRPMIPTAALVLALLATPATGLAQVVATETYRYPQTHGASGLGDLHAVQGVERQWPPRARLYFKLGEALEMPVSYVDTVEPSLDRYMGSPRTSLFPGADGNVGLFSVRNDEAIQALCPGARYLHLGVFQPSGFTVLRADQPVRLFFLKPAEISQGPSYELCRTLDFEAGAIVPED